MSGTYQREELVSCAAAMREKMVELAYQSKYPSHFGGGLSSVELLLYLYKVQLHYDLNNKSWADRDRFILSKGHGVLSFYVILQECGFFSEEVLRTFQTNESDLISHPVCNLELGIESSNGSLGQGLAFAVGNQLAARMEQRSYCNYVLMGDGECDEGSVWEAAMSAAQYHLDHLVGIIDFNGLQSDGTNDAVMSLGDLQAKWESFGWDAVVIDGHDFDAIHGAFSALDLQNGKPKMIIAKTVKGKGVSFMEHQVDWHHKQLGDKEYEAAMESLRNGGVHDGN